MNGWILAGTIMVGLAIVASLALTLRDARSQMKAERAGFLKRIDTLNENILTLAGERNTALAERDKQTKRMDAALRERDELREQLETVTAERDSLQGYLDQANAGRHKAQAQLEEVLLARTHVPKPRRQAKPPTPQEEGKS